ncbi:dipeptidase PepV [Fructilactobacillus fructivorans]|uniref:dipeptidase PepV n=1 Tax=Fructilactobacillus fructivorans TaxID=1614 RepID=UPI000704B0DA|nr:dipeptidase PepV [Fructilactobacillus fructivorans]KRN42310.1 dipeptidase PepV [Fructilactobacillus fructivorans]
MAIDWKSKAQDYKNDYLNDLKKLVSIDSSRDLDNATDEFPLGPGPAHALQQFLEFGDRDGFTTKNIDNVVGYIEYGSGDETMAILSHADEMPGGAGWDTNPFELKIDGDNAIGRGVSDDKGPGLAAYYGLKMLKDQGIEPQVKIRLIIGTDEECDWTGMKRYFEVEPTPSFGFSPDAEFPLINGEKGNVTIETHFDSNQSDGDNTLINFKAGLRENMVPRDAEAEVTAANVSNMADRFEQYLDKVPVTGSYEIEGDNIKLTIVGKAAHGMEPKNGINAGTYLADFLVDYSFDTSGANIINFIDEKLHDDSRAHKLGLNFTDDVMGELTMNVGLMNFSHKDGGMVNTNFRYPKGITTDTILAKMQDAADRFNGTTKQISQMDPHFVDENDPIVKKLMGIYREQTDLDDAQPEVVGGGTYARMMKRGVAFGALFPGAEDTMHQANEYSPVNDLILAMSIYGQSIYELSK